jgi:hypothetical protein
MHFEVVLFDPRGGPIRIVQAFFVLVLSASGTRRYGFEYEYHFIEYEYERSRKNATLKIHTPVIEPTQPDGASLSFQDRNLPVPFLFRA